MQQKSQVKEKNSEFEPYLLFSKVFHCLSQVKFAKKKIAVHFVTGGTYAGGEDAGSGFVKVERSHASHAVGNEGQHVTARERASVSPKPFTLTPHGHRQSDSHFPSFQRDDHLVVSNEVGLGAVQRDLHFVLHP